MEHIDKSISFFLDNSNLLLFSAGLVFFFFLLRILFFKLIRSQAKRNNIAYNREMYMRKLFDVLMTLIILSVLGAIWEISLQGLSLYFASILTVLGVALFATWSVLSNLTVSIFLFFFFPYRIGQKVKIIDGDNSIEGVILDINLFYIRIETDDKNIVACPNNIAVQKPWIIKFKN